MIRWARTVGHPSSVLIRDTKSRISQQIRLWSWYRGEQQGSWVNHYAYLGSDRSWIVEALFGGVEQGTLAKYDDSNVCWGIIIEHLGFSLREHTIADGAALAFVGKPYNVVSIAKQFLDGLFSKLLGRDVYLLRRLSLPGVAAMICSQLGVKVHRVAGWKFMGLKTVYRKEQKGISLRLRAVQILAELPDRRAAPDCIWDDALEHRPSLYRIVGEINPDLRPPDLIPVIAAKIDKDLAW